MLQVFSFEQKQVRFVGTVDNPEWIAQDVCQCLDLGNVSQALESLDEDEKGITIIDTPGGEQEMLTVLEPGFYHLIFKSRKPAAKRFKRWVFHEVLPSIRKTGSYKSASVEPVSPASLMAELNMAEQLLLELGVDAAVIKQLKVDNAIALLPSARKMLEAGKKFLSAADPIDTVGMNATQVGEHLNPVMDAKEVNGLLEEMGLQYKMHRNSTKTGKAKWTWQVTEEGEKYSDVHKVSNSNNGWNGGQIKWQKAVVDLIQGYLEDKAA